MYFHLNLTRHIIRTVVFYQTMHCSQRYFFYQLFICFSSWGSLLIFFTTLPCRNTLDYSRGKATFTFSLTLSRLGGQTCPPIHLFLYCLKFCITNTYWNSLSFGVFLLWSFCKEPEHSKCFGLIFADTFWTKSLIF